MRAKLLLSAAAVATLSVGVISPAQAAPDTNTTPPAHAAARWLAGQLVNGDHLQSSGYDDAGLTIDAVLGFDALGVAGDAATKATAWLARPDVVATYIGDGAAESYAERAKLALSAIAQGEDPENFGGRKLLTELAGLQEASGRYSDKSQWGNYSNTLGQSLAIIALQRTPAKAPASAVDFLVGSQCADGSFPQDFGTPTCVGSVDATGLVVQALLASGQDDEADRALDWLVARQQANGGFTAGSTVVDAEHPINANSTGNALQALRAGDRDAAGDKAAAYLTSVQIGCAGPADQRGAITYDGAFSAGKAPRSTVGGVLGLAGVPLVEVSSERVDAAVPTLDCGAPGTPTATPTAPPARAAEGLPVTGASVGILAGVGAAMLALGAVLVAVMRRRRFQ